MTDALLPHYQAIERTSEHMLLAARQADWDEVERLQACCAMQIESLQRQEPATGFTREGRARKQRILLAILRHDAQIRALAEPWLADMGDMLTQPANWRLQ
jgi:flagellar protein FliT